jgi:hypothetical protein
MPLAPADRPISSPTSAINAPQISDFTMRWNMSYEEAIEKLSRDEAFKATVYAMNTLLIHKGIYTAEEYRTIFVEWAEKEERTRGRRGSISVSEDHPPVGAYRTGRST